jgi:hypothetical protein
LGQHASCHLPKGMSIVPLPMGKGHLSVLPSISTVPDSGGIKPSSVLNSVVFPRLFGSSKHVTLPAIIVIDRVSALQHEMVRRFLDRFQF